MPTYQVIVPKLNKRKYPVEDTSDKANVVEVVLQDVFFEGEFGLNNKLGDWYKDKNGYYYWGGGIIRKEINQINESKTYSAWMQSINIQEIWRYTTGKNIGVGILDTGIIGNADLTYNEKHFIYESGTTLKDNVGHGTHCAGLIGARNKTSNLIGTAPDCNLYICKISDGDTLNEADTIRYAKAIDWCTEQNEIRIISISWASFINSQAIIDELQNAINRAVQRNKCIVCAMGDASQEGETGPIYPASLQNVIGVGSIPVDGLLYPYVNPSLITSCVGQDIPSYSITGQKVTMTGTSQSNAIIAGVVALLLEKNPLWGYNEIKTNLKSISNNLQFGTITIPVIDKDKLIKLLK